MKITEQTKCEKVKCWLEAFRLAVLLLYCIFIFKYNFFIFKYNLFIFGIDFLYLNIKNR